MTSTITTTASFISTCRRLLSSLQTDEARAAVDVCDALLEQHDRSRRLARLTSRPAPELLHGILRAIHPKEQKMTFAACSLINKAWRRVAWSLFWKEVKLSVEFSAKKFIHPWTVTMMGGNLRSLNVGGWSDIFLHRSPVLAGLRMVDLGGTIDVEELLSLFEQSPNLISLRAGITGSGGGDDDERSVNAEEEDMYMNDVGRGDDWKNHPPGSKEIWQAGFTKLYALHVSTVETVPCGLVMDMADSLGPNLKSLELGFPESPRVMNYVIRKVASNCPNLRDLSLPPYRAPIRDLLGSMPHLLYLELPFYVTDEMLQIVASTCTTLRYLRVICDCLTTIRSLTQGPSLRGCEIISWRDYMDVNELHEFLRHTGPTLEIFSFRYFDMGPGVDPKSGDHVLQCLRQWAPKLRQLEINKLVTEEGVATFVRASRKLRNLYLPLDLMGSEEIHDAAAERNVVVVYRGVNENYPSGSLPHFPSYIESAKERWIGM
ncbi:hypothetical protein HK104_001934 [Borealophlyctis nickersoniae]|nr:hypothetical protein HK104_001934 [Borealophlyctis nickersoniae]